ncbi:MAG: beta-ketoacyl-ACP synthase III [Acidobacteriota bacterium]|nr:beta-ketoacyl-ACP synthase III [Acidobacteriota bacterium]
MTPGPQPADASPDVLISGTGLFTPTDSISNEELVEAYNAWVDRQNETDRAAIAAGEKEAFAHSSAGFVQSASGIQSRYVMDREGILDPRVMAPRLRERSDDEPSIQCEMALAAADQAMGAAGCEGAEIDCVLVACSNLERPYPAVAVELQELIGAGGWAYDMNVACSSATFGIQAGVDALRAGSAERVLVVNPEICTGHLNFRDRDSHFIFGDACTAVVLERANGAAPCDSFRVLGTRLATRFSNNIRNNFGFLNRARPESIGGDDKLFVQQGRKVFKEIVPLVAELVLGHLSELGIAPESLRRLWLHQANLAMNQLIAKRVLGREPNAAEAPVILDRYANTSSAGSVIAFHQNHDDLQAGDLGLICSFGAGYSVGSVVVQRV